MRAWRGANAKRSRRATEWQCFRGRRQQCHAGATARPAAPTRAALTGQPVSRRAGFASRPAETYDGPHDALRPGPLVPRIRGCARECRATHCLGQEPIRGRPWRTRSGAGSTQSSGGMRAATSGRRSSTSTRPIRRCGPYLGYLRYRLALKVPATDPPSIRIKDRIHTWTERGSVLFDDSWNHEVYNRSPDIRVVLIVDVMRPMSPAVPRIELAHPARAGAGLRRGATGRRQHPQVRAPRRAELNRSDRFAVRPRRREVTQMPAP